MIRALVPVLVVAWVGAAATPCIAMTAVPPAGSSADAAHAHHAMPQSEQHAPHCPHCPPQQHEGMPTDDSSSHALCGSGDTAVVKDASAKPAKRDLQISSIDLPFAGPSQPRERVALSAEPAIDPHVPLRRRHLYLCIFLN